MEILKTSDGLGSLSQSFGRRATIFMAVLAFHIFFIVLLILAKQTDQPKKKQGTLSAFTLTAATTPPSVPVPAMVAILDVELVSSSPAESYAEQQQAIQGDPDGEVCSPLDAVTVQLANDPLVPMAISRVPQTDRSISEAIVVWNAEWSSASAAQDAPLAMVRDHVMLTLETLPPDCLATLIMGPRLIAIPAEGKTTFLAFGSGEWSWHQVVESNKHPVFLDTHWNWEQLLDGNLPSAFQRMRPEPPS